VVNRELAMSIKFISELEVRNNLDPKSVLDCIKNVFVDYAKGKAAMPSKVYLEMNTPGDDYRAMPAYTRNTAGIKWIADYTSNIERNISTTEALIILNNKHTGKPLSLIEGNFITQARTAATTALATQAILNGDKVKKIAFIGCGAQTMPHLQFLLEVVDVKEISFYDKNIDKAYNMAKSLGDVFEKVYVAQSVEECVKDSRIITTLTPSRTGYLTDKMLSKPVHINAVGADAVGKRELCNDIFFNCSTLVYDDKEQACHSGDTQYKKGPSHMHTNPHLKEYELKDVLRWSKKTLKEKIQKSLTVYDSTGLAIEDIAIAESIYEKIK
jgi:alanine dehydrogenase